MNVLIASASRKVWLVRAFQEVLGGSGRVLAADVTMQAPAMHIAAEPVLLPRTDDELFLDTLIQECERREVSLVVPTRDGELLVLGQNRQTLEDHGISVAVSDPDAVRTCLDKGVFNQHCRDNGFPTPEVIERPTVDDLPLFARPRQGQASTGAGVIRSEADLATCTDHVFARIVHASEYTIDVFLRRDGKAISAVPRERVLVVGGESQVTRTVGDDELVEQSAALCESIGLTGPATVQAFRADDAILFIEVNPRFGGASALSFRAGAPGPRWLVEETNGALLQSRLGNYEVGLTMLRYGADLFVQEQALQA